MLATAFKHFLNLQDREQVRAEVWAEMLEIDRNRESGESLEEARARMNRTNGNGTKRTGNGQAH